LFHLHAVAGLAFAGGLLPSGARILPAIGFCTMGLLLARTARRFPGPRVTAGCIVLTVAAFVYLKGYAIVPSSWALTGAYTLGLSYILFRVLSLVIEAGDGTVDEALAPIPYVAYLLSPFSFISGPIERYPDFAAKLAQARTAVVNDREAQAGLLRIAFGYVKVELLSSVMQSYFDRYSQFLVPEHLADAKQFEILLPTVIANFWHRAGIPADSSLGFEQASLFAILAPLYLCFIYVNFSGYMDMVVGFGRLFGIAVAENFNNPLAARNVLDFWTRWHMTLSNWFKIYFFNPLLMSLMKRYESANPNVLAVPTYFVTFLVLGIWHGTTPSFVVCGLLLGLGVAGNKLFQVGAGATLGSKRYRALSKSPWYGQLTRGMTFAYISCALVTMWAVNTSQLFQLLGKAAVPVFPVLAVLAGIGFATLDIARGLVGRLISAPPAALVPTLRVIGISSLVVVAILSKLVNGLGGHTFVYQGY
jgi:D-alanyl-lipoteichoic acid acyltransferase DltB (MBOAT superfamily)